MVPPVGQEQGRGEEMVHQLVERKLTEKNWSTSWLIRPGKSRDTTVPGAGGLYGTVRLPRLGSCPCLVFYAHFPYNIALNGQTFLGSSRISRNLVQFEVVEYVRGASADRNGR